MTLEKLKNYLRITWDDPGNDERLTDIMARGESILSNYAGAEIDFTSENSVESQLLLDLCRYIYNESLEEFKLNFGSELIALRAKYSLLSEEAKGEENEEIQTEQSL